MLPPTLLSSTPKSVVTRQELKADLLELIKEHDLIFTLSLLVEIAESESALADSEYESVSWTLDAWMIHSIIPHILH